MKLNITKSEKINSIISNRILQHIGYWVISFFALGYIWGVNGQILDKMYIMLLVEMPVKILAVYVTLYVMLPKLFFRKKIGLFVLATFLFMCLCAVIQRFVISHTYMIWFYGYVLKVLNLNLLLDAVFSINSFLIFPLFAKMLEYLFQFQMDLQRTENERVKAELTSLKTQVHPHFLFNTLNNLYSLVLTKSSEAEAVVLKLSELMRYMLYETSIARVSLDKELDFIRNYIDLETVRYKTKLDISLEISGDTEKHQITPLLLQPFIENCFKHGIANQISKGWINISIHVEYGKLIFKAQNSKEIHPEPINRPGGIGLENIKRRLELEYKGKYELEIDDGENAFSVLLQIEL